MQWTTEISDITYRHSRHYKYVMDNLDIRHYRHSRHYKYVVDNLDIRYLQMRHSHIANKHYQYQHHQHHSCCKQTLEALSSLTPCWLYTWVSLWRDFWTFHGVEDLSRKFKNLAFSYIVWKRPHGCSKSHIFCGHECGVTKLNLFLY